MDASRNYAANLNKTLPVQRDSKSQCGYQLILPIFYCSNWQFTHMYLNWIGIFLSLFAPLIPLPRELWSRYGKFNQVFLPNVILGKTNGENLLSVITLMFYQELGSCGYSLWRYYVTNIDMIQPWCQRLVLSNGSLLLDFLSNRSLNHS